MTFHIDISIDLRKAGNVTHHRQLVERNAEKNNAIDVLFNVLIFLKELRLWASRYARAKRGI